MGAQDTGSYLFDGISLKFIDFHRNKIKLTITEENKQTLFAEFARLQQQLVSNEFILQLNNAQIENIIDKTKYRPTFEMIKIKHNHFNFNHSSIDNMHNLFELFGYPFLAFVFKKKLNHHTTELLTKFIEQLTIEQISEAYEFIIKNIHDIDSKNKILQQLGCVLKIESAKILAQNPALTWFIAYSQPQLLQTLNAQELLQLITTPLTAATFPYAIDSINNLHKQALFPSLEDHFL